MHRCATEDLQKLLLLIVEIDYPLYSSGLSGLYILSTTLKTLRRQNSGKITESLSKFHRNKKYRIATYKEIV